MIRSHTFRGAAITFSSSTEWEIIKCLSTCSRSSRNPTTDSTYYPIPYYGALFRGKWYNIKQLIGIAKEAKLKNSAPIK